MTIKNRLAKLENQIDFSTCPQCNADIGVHPEYIEAAKASLADYCEHVSEAEAARILSEDFPAFTRALGIFVKPEGEHFCSFCGTDQRSDLEHVQHAVTAYTRHCSPEKAKALLREDLGESLELYSPEAQQWLGVA